jgi:uncharacterized DUF497 family protein
MQYNFEWDPEKAMTNRRKHGVTFEEAASVFLDPRMLTVFDDEHSGAEDRWLTLVSLLWAGCWSYATRSGRRRENLLRCESSLHERLLGVSADSMRANR